jgi:hypothetical protein
MVEPAPRVVLYCYGELNANVMRLQQQAAKREFGKTDDAEDSGWDLEVHNGVPEQEHVQRLANGCGGRLLLVLDDLMVGLRASFLDILFTRGSHNWGCSVVLITQHLFASRELRVARNNSHYIVLMRNPVGALQVRNLASQLFPGTQHYFMDAYADATSEPYGYLLIDMHPETVDAFRLRTHIYPGEVSIVYMPIEGSVSSSNKKAAAAATT